MKRLPHSSVFTKKGLPMVFNPVQDLNNKDEREKEGEWEGEGEEEEKNLLFYYS